MKRERGWSAEERACKEVEARGRLSERLRLAKMVQRRVRRLRASAFAAALPDDAAYVIAEAETIAHALASSTMHCLERVGYYVDEHVWRRRYREHAAKEERGAGQQLSLPFGPLVEVHPRFAPAATRPSAPSGRAFAWTLRF